jgi:hypothetical protein
MQHVGLCVRLCRLTILPKRLDDKQSANGKLWSRVRARRHGIAPALKTGVLAIKLELAGEYLYVSRN